MKKDEEYRVNHVRKNFNNIMGDGIVCPQIIDIHPVMNACNLSCQWCIGGKIIDKPIILTQEQVRMCMDMIFCDEKKEWWPQEIHICGNNSEPLINMLSIKTIIKYSKIKKFKLMIVSNGLLINKSNVNNLCKVDTFNISLDAVNNEDYIIKKCIRHEYTNPYDMILENISLLKNAIITNKTDCVLSTSFVITELEYINDNFINCIKELKQNGVDIVKVRFETIGDHTRHNDILRQKIAEINLKFNDINIICNAPNANDNNFYKCYSPFIWPALEANMKMYACAHCANDNFKELFDLSKDNYYDFYCSYSDNRYFTVSELNCGKICPPMLNAVNNGCIV